MKAIYKPRLFFFGDSFVQWHAPSPGHWTERFSDEYNVYRLGSSGASNDAIAGQFGVLPPYQKGDRIVAVLTEPSRLSKWIYCDYYMDYLDNRESLIDGKYDKKDFVSSLYEVRIRKDELTSSSRREHYHRYIDNPLQTFNLLGFLYSSLEKYKPVYVTWCQELIDIDVLGDLVTLISRSTFSTVAEEDPSAPSHDYHPGIEGGKVWYGRVKHLLDNWETRQFIPKPVGSDYFDPDTKHISKIHKLEYTKKSMI